MRVGAWFVDNTSTGLPKKNPAQAGFFCEAVFGPV
jgi:hypothetical protein